MGLKHQKTLFYASMRKSNSKNLRKWLEKASSLKKAQLSKKEFVERVKVMRHLSFKGHTKKWEIGD